MTSPVVFVVPILLAAVSSSAEVVLRRSESSPGLRVDGGEMAPWQVSIQTPRGVHFCGGAIIADRYILTAGSCVAGMQRRKVRVVTATNNYQNSSGSYNVSQIILHSEFDHPLYHNDVALLQLQNAVEFNAETHSVEMADEDELQTGDKLTAIGWGCQGDGQQNRTKLWQLEVEFLEHDECKARLNNLHHLDIGHLCAVARADEGLCKGDGGGPLVNAQGQLVGVANWVIPASSHYPSVYASVYFYRDWIRTTIQGCFVPSNDYGL